MSREEIVTEGFGYADTAVVKKRKKLIAISQSNEVDELYLRLKIGEASPEDLVYFEKDSSEGLSYSPIEVAAYNKHWGLVEHIMLGALASVLTDKKQSQTHQLPFILANLLLIALSQKQLDVASRLLEVGDIEKGIFVTGEKFKGFGPLQFAVHFKSVDLIKKLLAKGFSPVEKYKDNLSALEMAVIMARNQPEFWAFVILLTPTFDPESENAKALKNIYSDILLFAAIHNRLDVVKHLSSKVVDPNRNTAISRPYQGYTTLHFAFVHNNREMVWYLLAMGADPRKQAKDNSSFYSLLRGQDKELCNFIDRLSPEELPKTVADFIKSYPPLFEKKQMVDPGLLAQLSEGLAKAKGKIIAMFGGSTESTVRALGTQVDYLVSQSNSQSDQLKDHDTRLGHLTESAEKKEKAQRETATTNSAAQATGGHTLGLTGGLSLFDAGKAQGEEGEGQASTFDQQLAQKK